MTQRMETQAQRVELWAQSREPGAQGEEAQTSEDYSPALKPNGVFLAGFQNCLTLFSPFIFFPFGTWMFITVILCLFQHCIWEQITYFLSFTGPQMERNCAPGWIIPKASPWLNLDDLGAETWDFWADLIYMRFWTLNWSCNGLRLWGTWDGMNIFCVWDRYESFRPKADCGRVNNGCSKMFTS